MYILSTAYGAYAVREFLGAEWVTTLYGCIYRADAASHQNV